MADVGLAMAMAAPIQCGLDAGLPARFPVQAFCAIQWRILPLGSLGGLRLRLAGALPGVDLALGRVPGVAPFQMKLVPVLRSTAVTAVIRSRSPTWTRRNAWPGCSTCQLAPDRYSR